MFVSKNLTLSHRPRHYGKTFFSLKFVFFEVVAKLSKFDVLCLFYYLLDLQCIILLIHIVNFRHGNMA